MDDERLEQYPKICEACGHDEFENGGDGFYYCRRCCVRLEDIVDTAVADEAEARRLYCPQFCRRSVPRHLGSSSSISCDLSLEDYSDQVRMRYALGVQRMIQLQCEALIGKFGVSPLICEITGDIWFKYIEASGIFAEDWAEKAIRESEFNDKPAAAAVKAKDSKPTSAKYNGKPCNLHGKRAVLIWFRALKEKLPISCSLAISFLSCHVAREAILPTDILKWSLEGTLPYLNAFVEIEKDIGDQSSACPLSSRFMFRPSELISSQNLEASAAFLADSIGMLLPPVNFHAIAKRYLKILSVPVEKILPQACRVYEWSFPPELWLSENESRLPTRVGVMSILIVTIRMHFNINGFGYWEKSLSNFSRSCSLSLQNKKCEPASNSKSRTNEVGELLNNLEATYQKLENTYEYSQDLPTYLKYCKDVVFAGQEPSDMSYDEEKLIEQLWEIYENQMDVEPSSDTRENCSTNLNQKKMTEENEDNNSNFPSMGKKRPRRKGKQSSTSGRQVLEETPQERAIRHMKLNMKENRFLYIPPKANSKSVDYLQYVKKKQGKCFIYAAHADYYILLRTCARLAQVDIRIMHDGVLSFERRLGWLENMIDHCLNLKAPSVCEHCSRSSPSQPTDETSK